MWYYDELVSVEYDGGTAAVVVDGDGDVWLSSDREGGTLLGDFDPAVEGLPGRRFVQGGRLPPGAVAAVVVDVRGEERVATAAGGAWVIVLDGDIDGAPNPTRYVDASGAIVAPPLPPEWAREPLTDATEACPACGAREWDVVTPAGESGGGSVAADGDFVPHGFTTCRRCGFQEGGGMSYGVTCVELESDDPDPEVLRAAEEEQREREAALLRRVDFPVYVVAGRAAKLAGWGSRGHGSVMRVSSIDVHHGEPDGPSWLLVETERTPDEFCDEPATTAIRALENSLDRGEAPELSTPALLLWFSARERELRRELADASLTERTISVDGRDVSFTVAALGDRWAAVARTPSLTVTAAGVAIEDVELVAVKDPLTLLS